MILKALFRLLSPAPQTPQPIEPCARRADVLYAHARVSVWHASTAKHSTPKISGNHRAWILSMRLDHLRICSVIRSKRLSDLGIETAGDLLTANLDELSRQMDKKLVIRSLKRMVQAIRFAASVPGMMPRDAMLLICIHRRGIRSLACEKPAVLHRDLERFALSSKGKRALQGRRLPSVKRIRGWIETCADAVSGQSLRVAA